jgi:hypothetical protein
MKDVIQLLETRREEQMRLSQYKEQLKADNLALIRQKIYEKDQRQELLRQIGVLQAEMEKERLERERSL